MGLIDTRFTQFVIFVNCLVPFLLLVWDGYHNKLGANPLDFITHATGKLALVFLLISLAVTPVRKFTGWNQIIKYRRMLGLYAFFYAALHLLTYVWFDNFFDLKTIVQETIKRPFIAVGMLGFLLMVPLAVTSTNGMIKRLGGRRWSRLHQSIYLVVILGVVHYWMLVKADIRQPLLFAGVLALLLGYRIATKSLPRLLQKTPSISPVPRR
jgi:sulfoxide reductase heme-binding subunit YedZ